MKFKLITTSALVAGLLLTSPSFASPAKNTQSGKSYSSLPANAGITKMTAAQINCYNNPSDVCIANNSNQGVSFNVGYTYPSQPVIGPLNPNQWVDAYSGVYFPSVYVTITNAYGQTIFAQNVPDHSIININNEYALASANGKKALKVTVN